MSIHLSGNNNWLRCLHPKSESVLRLFCFPPAGSGALFFRKWALADVFPEAEVYAICLPGRESRLREPLFTDIHLLVSALLPNMISYLDIPFLIVGHSLGAIVGFEVVNRLQNQGLPLPLKLFVSARQAPTTNLNTNELHLLPNSKLKEKLHLYAGTPVAVLQNDELMNLFLPIIRADLKMNETYNAGRGVQLDCPISAFAGLNDPVTSVSDVSRWAEHTKRSFELHTYPGGHFPTNEEIRLIMSIIEAEVKAEQR